MTIHDSSSMPSEDQQLELIPVYFNPFEGEDLLITAPTTESQKEIWTSVQFGDSANCAYNESQSLLFRGELDVDSLRLAIQQLICRHEALRTTFSSTGSTHCIIESLSIEIPYSDLSELSRLDQEGQLETLKRQEVEQPFNLEYGPLIRAKIIKLKTREHLLLITCHHIICDGWSWGILISELGRLYSSLLLGEEPELEAAEAFSQYALHEQEQANTPKAVATEEYWLRQFSDSIPVLEFPTDRSRPSIRTFSSAREDWQLDPSLVTGLIQTGRKLGCTLMTTILAGFEVWLSRITQQEDVVVGIPAAGQVATGRYSLVGHCVNLLPLRSRIHLEQSFSDYLRERRSAILDAYEHQQFSFGSLVKRLALPRDSNHIPLVPITFNLDQHLDTENLNFVGLEVEIFTNPRIFENFEIFINISDINGQPTLECQYNTNLFDAITIRRRLAEFETLLKGIVVNSNRSISTLPLLPEEENKLLEVWNNTRTIYPREKSIHELFEEQVGRKPDAISLVFEEEEITYRELNSRANQLAHYLQKLGVGPEVFVGICIERSIEMIVAVLGILKAGGAYIPLDPDYPQERLAFMLEDIQPHVLLTQQSLVEKLPENKAHILCLDSDWQTLFSLSEGNKLGITTAENLAYIIYTSGSTGTPKGVGVPHRAVVRLVKGTDYANFNSDETFLQLAPISFDASTFEIWGSLLNGAKLVIFPPGMPSLVEVGQAIRRYNVTTLLLTTGLFNLMVDERLEDLKPLRQLLVGGDVLSVQHVQKFLRETNTCKLINGYGPTENTTFTCCYHITQSEDLCTSIPIGRPIANTQVYILDSHLNTVPIGVKGELHVGGDGLARGYLNNPELTAERFIANPFSNQPWDRLYKTGDLARFLPDGNIEFLGRIDNQVKIRGFRIELSEIEVTLSQHSCVAQTAIICQEITPSDKRLVAYVVPDEQPLIANLKSKLPNQLRDFLKQKLPDYMIPSTFVLLETLPLTPNGKVDRRALPAPDQTGLELERACVFPRTLTEEMLAQIWANIFSLRLCNWGPSQISIHDNFFELGGHSLLAVNLISQVRKIFQIDLPLHVLFQSPTLAGLAVEIESEQHNLRLKHQNKLKSHSYLRPIRSGGSKTPLFLIPGGNGGEFELITYAKLVYLLGHEQPVYGFSARALDGTLNLHRTVEEMAAHYIQEIRAVQPEGPYLLGGECVGGVVAMEMAQQLVAHGQRLGLLVLLDTTLPSLYREFSYHVNNLNCNLKVSSMRILKLLKKLPSLMMENSLTHLRFLLKNKFSKVSLSSNLFNTGNHYAKIIQSYRPRSYPGKITLIVTEGSPLDTQYQDWNSLAIKGLEIDQIPATHTSYLGEDVEVLAKSLKAYLQAAQAED